MDFVKENESQENDDHRNEEEVHGHEKHSDDNNQLPLQQMQELNVFESLLPANNSELFLKYPLRSLGDVESLASEASFVSCSFCLFPELSPSSLFCTSCGSVQIRNQYIHSKSTADYDPGNRALKPWKENPLPPPSTKATTSYQVKKIVPWHSAGYVPPKQNLPRLVSQVDYIEPKQLDSDSMDEVNRNDVKYLGRYWRKEGYSYRRKKRRGFRGVIKAMMSTASLSKNLHSEDFHDDEMDHLFPLAIYSLNNRNKDNESNIVVHVSLFERQKECAERMNCPSRWIRVGIIENKNSTEEEDDEELSIINYAPNAVAQYYGVADTDWVDINYIDQGNTYMVIHIFLQH